MAWTSPMTWVANVPLTAAQLNTFVRDNFNETAPGRATTAGSWFISSGRNVMAERTIAAATNLNGLVQRSSNWGNGNSSSAPPTVTAITGAQALVWMTADAIIDQLVTADAFSPAYMGFEVTGASSIAPSDERSLSWTHLYSTGAASATARYRQSYGYWVPLTPGSNTFTAKFRLGTRGPTASATFTRIELTVMAL